MGRQISKKADERTIYAQEKPNEAECDAELQFILLLAAPAKIRELKRRIL